MPAVVGSVTSLMTFTKKKRPHERNKKNSGKSIVPRWITREVGKGCPRQSPGCCTENKDNEREGKRNCNLADYHLFGSRQIPRVFSFGRQFKKPVNHVQPGPSKPRQHRRDNKPGKRRAGFPRRLPCPSRPCPSDQFRFIVIIHVTPSSVPRFYPIYATVISGQVFTSRENHQNGQKQPWNFVHDWLHSIGNRRTPGQ